MKLITCSVLMIIFCVYAFAQENTDEINEAKNEIMFWAGGSPTSNNLIGTTENARFGIAGVRYARIFKPGKNIALKYTVDAVPVSVLSYPTFRFVPDGTGGFQFERRRESAFGAGVAPLGIQVNFRRQKKVQPFVNSSGGFIYFTKKIPSEFGSKFNFTAELGGGVQFMLRNKKAISVGYKYHHLSNGYRSDDNPGFDSNIFYVGFSLFK